MWRRARSGLSLVALLCACVTPPSGFGPRGCPVVPVPSAALPEATTLHYRARFESGQHEIGLEAIVQIDAEGLLIVGLAPEGMRLFALRQRGREFAFEPPSAPLLGFGVGSRMERLGTWLLDALHRGIWIEAPSGSAPKREANWSREGEDVSESWREARRHREFRRSGEPRGGDAPVAVDHLESETAGLAGGFEVRNDWCGYRATLVPWDTGAFR